VNNSFVKQFAPNIKFNYSYLNIKSNYSYFDRVILRGYILRLFPTSGVVLLLRALGFNSLSNGIMRLRIARCHHLGFQQTESFRCKIQVIPAALR